jgi:hypothetical protein
MAAGTGGRGVSNEVKMTDHLAIWNAVKETAHSATKSATVSGQKITSINGTYMVQRATEVFGPVGKGWGYEIVEERLDDAGPVYAKNADGNQEVIGNHRIHTLHLRLWYLMDGERCTVEHFGHTPFTYRSQHGISVDGEAPKKSLTDAIKKCLSMLGFSADVFLGEWDDREYVEAAKTKDKIRKADDADQAYITEKAKFIEWCEREIRAFYMIPNRATLKGVFQGQCRHIERQCQVLGLNPDPYITRFREEFEKADTALQQKTPAEQG